MDIGVCLPVNDFSGILVDMDSIAAQHAFHLCRRHRQAQRAADLLTDLIQTADHAKFQTAAGRCIGDTVVQAHQIHRPATDIRHDHRRLIQQDALGQDCGITLREQRHLADGDRVFLSLIAETHRSPVPEQIVPECIFLPSEAGERQSGRQMDLCCRLRMTEGELLCDGCQRKEVVVLCLRFVLLKRLTPAAHHIEFSAVFQHVLQRIWLMLIRHQTGGEREMGRFHSGIAVVNTNNHGLAHLASPPRLRFFLFDVWRRS